MTNVVNKRNEGLNFTNAIRTKRIYHKSYNKTHRVKHAVYRQHKIRKNNITSIRNATNRGLNSKNASFILPSAYNISKQTGAYISWSNNWKLNLPGQGQIIFDAFAQRDLLISISSQKQGINPLYEIVIGSNNNTSTKISKQMQGRPFCYYAKYIPNNKIINNYNIILDKRSGYITIIINDLMFAQCHDENFLKNVQWFSFSSGNNTVLINNLKSLPLN